MSGNVVLRTCRSTIEDDSHLNQRPKCRTHVGKYIHQFVNKNLTLNIQGNVHVTVRWCVYT